KGRVKNITKIFPAFENPAIPQISLEFKLEIKKYDVEIFKIGVAGVKSAHKIFAPPACAGLRQA
uniref:Uncharacterized protein n=1 Tax=Romanomermis culicivorax TaxID=13658 RepID=A0A915L163_ROMCU